jgi:hypothetical protein
MAEKTGEKKAATEGESFPSCCKDLADKMEGCGPMLERMMSRISAGTLEGGCCQGGERSETG